METKFLLTVTDWSEVASAVLLQPVHEDLYFSKAYLPHPEILGISKELLTLQGELADYRITLADGKSIHIREYQNYYAVHWDKYDPGTRLIDHLRYDAPEWWIALTTWICYSIAKDKPKGAFLGLLVGVLTQGKSEGEGDLYAS